MTGIEYKPYVIDAGYLFPPSLADFLGPEDEGPKYAEAITEGRKSFEFLKVLRLIGKKYVIFLKLFFCVLSSPNRFANPIRRAGH